MILTIIGIIVLVVVLILLLILYVPFHISFHVEKSDGDIRGSFQVRWLKLTIVTRPIPPEEKEEKEEEKKERKFNLDETLDVVKKFLDALEYIVPILRAFKESMKLDKISIHLDFGFSSPVTTAQVSGYIWSILPIINFIPQVDVSLTPDFQNTKFDGSFKLELELTLYRLARAVIVAFTKKPVRDLMGSARKLNK